jgi:ABC-type transporter Mla subunit MlaD
LPTPKHGTRTSNRFFESTTELRKITEQHTTQLAALIQNAERANQRIERTDQRLQLLITAVEGLVNVVGEQQNRLDRIERQNN